MIHYLSVLAEPLSRLVSSPHRLTPHAGCARHSFVVPIESPLVINPLAESVDVPSFVAPFQIVRGKIQMLLF